MKLSEAILLGDSLKKADPTVWLSPDGACGCAFGGALLAAGTDIKEFWKQFRNPITKVFEIDCVRNLWPWIDDDILCQISNMYHDVARGKMKIEQIADYVRGVEPGENGKDGSGENESYSGDAGDETDHEKEKAGVC